MRVDIFRQNIPETLISKNFSPFEREEAKLMVVWRRGGEIEHKKFSDIFTYFSAGDVFVVNDSYLLNGFFTIENNLGNVFLLREKEENVWEALFSSVKRIKTGTVFQFPALDVCVEVLDSLSSKIKLISFKKNGIPSKELLERIKRNGEIDMEEYIGRPFEDEDKNKVRDIFARSYGSLVPNVAGLHFTEKMKIKMELKAVSFASLTYHVIDRTVSREGTKTLDGNRISPEKSLISSESIEKVNNAILGNKRVCSVGFSAACALENLFNPPLRKIVRGETIIAFSPVVPTQFLATNAYLTNFYPEGHPSLRVDSGFCGSSLLKKIYSEAIKNNYNFSIYGDSLLVL